MNVPLTRRVETSLNVLFSEPERTKISNRLREQASNNLPLFEKAKSEDLDRIRFAIIKLISEGSYSEDSAFELATVDWRDLYMAAGFANSEIQHDTWYNELLNSREGCSSLFYFGTDTEVNLGDRVGVKRWFKVDYGNVAFIPRLSAHHPQVKTEDEWLIRMDRGDFLSTPYLPTHPRAQPSPKIMFIQRSNDGILSNLEDIGPE